MAITPPTNTPPPATEPPLTNAGAERLRDRIDHGATGDKVDYPDPAAAPLGTDAEAGGFPPTPQDVALAKLHETVPGDQPNTRGPGDPLRGKTGPSIGIYAAVAVVVLLVLWLIW